MGKIRIYSQTFIETALWNWKWIQAITRIQSSASQYNRVSQWMRNEKSGSQNKKTPQIQNRLTQSARWRKHFSRVLFLFELPEGHTICELCRGGVKRVILPGTLTSPRASMFSKKIQVTFCNYLILIDLQLCMDYEAQKEDKALKFCATLPFH